MNDRQVAVDPGFLPDTGDDFDARAAERDRHLHEWRRALLGANYDGW